MKKNLLTKNYHYYLTKKRTIYITFTIYKIFDFKNNIIFFIITFEFNILSISCFIYLVFLIINKTIGQNQTITIQIDIFTPKILQNKDLFAIETCEQ